MAIILSALPFLITLGAVVQGFILLVRGKLKRRFAKGYDIFYEGVLVRILGLISIMLGIVFALIMLEIVSAMAAIVLFLLILLLGGVAGVAVQQNDILIKK